MTVRAGFATALAEVCERTGWIAGDQEVQIDFDSGRSQRVRIEFFDFEGDELVRFYTTIGDAERIDPMRLSQGLRISFGLPHGALALRKSDLVMVDTLMLETVDARRIEAVLRYLAETADHFEQTMFGGDSH